MNLPPKNACWVAAALAASLGQADGLGANQEWLRFLASSGAVLLTFLAGAGLGYFLELWGTTRQCWTYYTYQTPPLFAVLAHGMASVAFWRANLVMGKIIGKVKVSRWVKAEG